jgi:hypothetical protein
VPRYHFHIIDGRTLLDPEGVELPDPAGAREEALRLVGEILRDPVQSVAFGSRWRLEATDSAGNLLLGLDLSLPAPAGG